MAYQFADTFDHYATASTMYESVTGSPVISNSYARFPAVGSYPNQGIYLPGASVRKNLQSNQSTLIAFYSFGIAALPSSGTHLILPFWDNGTCQCFLGITSTGALQFCRQVPTYSLTAIGPSSALGLIAPFTSPNHGIEVQVSFSATNGSVECWLDGSLVIAQTSGLNTIVTANAYANQAGLNASNSLGLTAGMSIYSDYFRVWDTTGSYQNAPLGLDRRKLTKLPMGAGDLTQWTPNGPATNWQCVNENPPDGDVTYVASTAASTFDSYAMGASSLGTVPSMVVAKSYVRKDDSNTRAIEIGVRSSGVNGLSSPITVGSSYAFVDTCISVDPNTGSPPTAAAADAYQHLKNEST